MLCPLNYTQYYTVVIPDMDIPDLFILGYTRQSYARTYKTFSYLTKTYQTYKTRTYQTFQTMSYICYLILILVY